MVNIKFSKYRYKFAEFYLVRSGECFAFSVQAWFNINYIYPNFPIARALLKKGKLLYNYQKQFDLKFYSQTEQEEFPIIKSIFYSGKYENHIRISALSELDPTIINLIRQSYKLL